MKEFLLITILLTFLDFKQSHSFSVQKRRTQAPSDFHNAVKVLRRKRRRIDESDLRDRLYGDLSDSMMPYDEYSPYKDDYRNENPDDLADEYVLANMLNAYPERYRGDIENSKDQIEESETPTINELKKMFNEIDNKSEGKGENEQESSNSKSDLNSDVISQQQMDELLSEAVKIPPTETKSPEDEQEKSNNPEPVSTDELKDVFKESKPTQTGGNDNNEKSISLSDEYINSNQGNSLMKKKRMTKRDNRGDTNSQTDMDETVLNLVQENQELRGRLNRMKVIEYLEDKENDQLASALKDATLAQLGHAENYLEDEYAEIQKALEIEQSLQEIKDSDPDEELQEEEEEESMDVKRSDPSYQDNLGVWYEQPLGGQAETNAQRQLEDFVKQYRQTYNLDNDEGDEESNAVEVPVPQSVGDICPQLELLTSNCEVAALLDIDNEARELCNRHEVCYSCGKIVGFSKKECDSGFRSETVQRCRSSNCIQSGAEFLWFIKQDHKYNNRYLEQCDDPCVREYIVGE